MINEENSNVSTQEEVSVEEESENIESYSHIFSVYSSDPKFSQWIAKPTKTKSMKTSNILHLINLKRNHALKNFREIKHLSANLPEFKKANQDITYKLFYNICLISQSICLCLTMINGDLTLLSHDFLNSLSCLCFSLLKQGSNTLFQSFEESYLHLINGLKALQIQTSQTQKEIRQITNFCLHEFEDIINNKFLVCELLFILYETILDDVNDASKILLTNEERR
jgi:hypothetical protein